MKIAVSIPDELFEKAEAEAKRLGMSRSKVVQTALAEHFQSVEDAEFTARINRCIEKYGDPSAGMEPLLEMSLRTAFANSEWDE